MGRRSKGCTVCKARHVKCDEGLPSCQQCLKLGKPCEYAPKFSFIDDGARTRHKLKRQAAQSHSHSITQSSRLTMYHSGVVTASMSRITHSTHLASFKDTIYLSFLVKKLTYERIGDSPILNLHKDSSTSHTAIIALATLTFGQAHYSTDIVLESRKAYGKCLLLLQKDIMDPVKCLSLSTLESVAALCMYEVPA